MLGRSTLREIKLLRELRHVNLIRLVDVFIDADKEPHRLALVYDYCDHDLKSLISQQRARNQTMPHCSIKSIVWQILRGLCFLHSNWVVHRDMKPQNILIKGRRAVDGAGTVKIADFGLARSLRHPPVELTEVDPEVVTLWYRAPELLLGAKHYNFAVDVWSLDAFAEMLNEEIFPQAVGVKSSGKKKGSERAR